MNKIMNLGEGEKNFLNLIQSTQIPPFNLVSFQTSDVAPAHDEAEIRPLCRHIVLI